MPPSDLISISDSTKAPLTVGLPIRPRFVDRMISSVLLEGVVKNVLLGGNGVKTLEVFQSAVCFEC